MNTWIRAHLRLLSLIILGSLLGALSGFCLGHLMLLRATRLALSTYARELSANSDQLADEINLIFVQMNAPGPSPCSDFDLDVMKARTFTSGHVKDIGRTHQNKLYCSAFLGRLKHPYVEGPSSLALADGLNIYTNVAVLVASKGDAHGTIVEAGDINIVLNSDAFGHPYRPHMSYMVAAVNPKSAQMITITGSPIDIDLQSILSQQSQVLQGSLITSVCSTRHAVCVVTAEHLKDVWKTTRSTQLAYSLMGGFAGLSVALIVFLFYKRTTSLPYQLLRAIRKDSPSLFLVYQPIIDVGTGRCVGAEALLRWRNQSGSFISPDIFIPLAEESAFIHQLTALVVRRATRELFDMLNHCDNFTLSINIAASDLGDGQLFQLLRDHVSLTGIAPGRIALELTERSTADLNLVAASIERLCAEGYKVHIDDFGVGFSSLSYIDQLHVNAIKIDRTFTRMIGTDAVIAPIFSQILGMAQSLGVEVVVEGVETDCQRDYLAASGMALRAQGWFFSKPLSAQNLRLFEAQNKAGHESALSRSKEIPSSAETSGYVEAVAELCQR